MKILLLFLALALPAFATTRNCNGSVSDFNTQVGLSADGDTILFTAGGTWASTGTLSGRGITVDLGGFTITRGATSAVLIAMTTDATAFTRITNGTIANGGDGTGSNYRAITIGGSFSNPKFRLDHLTISTAAEHAVHIEIDNAWGLIDNCTISGDDASEMIHNLGTNQNSTSNTGWNEVITPGSVDALYIETCTFSKSDQTDAFFWGTSAVQSYYGARTVLRYCTLNYVQIDQHGDSQGGNVSARWGEYYHNDFHLPSNGGGQNQGDYIDFRGGSGVIWSNTRSGGTNDGGNNINIHQDGSPPAGPYPMLWQPGRGKDTTFPPITGSDQALAPIYCWSNTAATPTGQATFVIDGRDFFSNTTLSPYTPYTYPYPWSGGSSGKSVATGKIVVGGKSTVQ